MPVCELSCDVDDATFYAQSNDPNFDIDAHSDKVNELGKNSIESPVEPFSKAKFYLKVIGSAIFYFSHEWLFSFLEKQFDMFLQAL